LLTIDRMKLTLPHGYGPHAGHISRLVADDLAAARIPASARLEHLAPASITVQPGTSHRELARQIVRAIIDAIGREVT